VLGSALTEPVMIASYRMAQEGWTAKGAMQAVHECGYRDMHHLMYPDLNGYKKSVLQRLQNNPCSKTFAGCLFRFDSVDSQRD
jgi:hypothetical protein